MQVRLQNFRRVPQNKISDIVDAKKESKGKANDEGNKRNASGSRMNRISNKFRIQYGLQNHFFIFNSFRFIVKEEFVFSKDFTFSYDVFYLLFPDKVFLDLFYFLKEYKNFFNSFVPLVKGSFRIIPKNFSSKFFLSLIRAGSLLVFLKKCVLGKGGNSN